VLGLCRRFWDGEFAHGSPHRAGEADDRHFRSDRIYQSDGHWYCRTREGAPLGPFAAIETARGELAVHISPRKPSCADA